MSRKQNSLPSAAARAAGPARAPAEPSASWMLETLCASLLAMRLLTATEGAAQGTTLGIVVFAFAGLTLYGFELWRGAVHLPRLALADLVVAGLCLAFPLAGALNNWTGDTQAMVNLTCEWGGLLATWLILRHVAHTSAGRAAQWSAVVAVAVVLSGLGVWQHSHGYDQPRAVYRQLDQRWKQLESRGRPADPRAAAEWERELQDIQWQLMAMGVPADERGRALWEARLEASNEPLGMFALANTLAGLLLSATVFLACMAAARVWRRVAAVPQHAIRPAILVGAAACLALLVYCLLLTKSRSAMVALLMTALALAWRLKTGLPEILRRRLLAGSLAALLGAGLLGVVAYAAGGIDRQLFTEAAKSLRYRVEYWQGSMQVLFAEPAQGYWLRGVGPGNFRAHYLRYKLPASSEEIADPHNLFLDAWCNGGLLALLFLLALLASLVRPAWQAAGAAAVSTECTAPGTRPSSPWRERLAPARVGVAAALATVAFTVSAYDESFARLLACLIPACWLCEWMIMQFISRSMAQSAGAWAALALSLNLCGAGGIAMPALAQLLLLAMAGAIRQPADPVDGARRRATRLAPVPGPIMGVAGLTLATCCLMLVLLPGMQREALLAEGDEALYARRNAEAAERAYRQAARVDPLSVHALDRLAGLAELRWQASPEPSGKTFTDAVDARRKVIAANPGSYLGYRALAELYLARYNRTASTVDAAAAADALATAVELYPTHAGILALMADALKKSGDAKAAHLFAQKALWLDQLNRAAGHVDKLLPEKTLHSLRELLKPELTGEARSFRMNELQRF